VSGGVVIDLCGCLFFEGLYVCGEVVCLGVYGVNCFVFNFLFEGLVFVYCIVDDFIVWLVVGDFVFIDIVELVGMVMLFDFECWIDV